jgi:hypothetical protein
MFMVHGSYFTFIFICPFIKIVCFSEIRATYRFVERNKQDSKYEISLPALHSHVIASYILLSL